MLTEALGLGVQRDFLYTQ